ncbi:hypothetical protein VB715_21325 [Crocosphaera sp. UHCC 0190]|uniref:hypothetical protein n=1 Tax=Crocosphaera sp. UHCC 0190 TaxID=3110246 RepID=UPI002B211337|nr:hypothetical protein [Crocosphaera sp. UHCC 0190]MEA5512318.1 hypothetical protein [Crocosphaera sp. UHCC 0190]
MNTQLVDSLSQIIQSLTSDEKELLKQKAWSKDLKTIGDDFVQISLKLGSFMPDEALEQLQKLNKISSQEDWQEIADLFARSLLDYQYKVVTKKITQQFDSEWLETLETEEDLLNAAIELTIVNRCVK